MGDCPSEERLAGYLLGEEDADSATIRAHLEACEPCRRWVTEVREHDLMLDSLRRLMDAEADAPTLTAAPAPPTPRPSREIDLSASSASFTIAGGDDLIEGYIILDELGRGGMGVVYRALQKSTKRKVALKVLIEGPFASATSKRRFEREVELAAQLQHPNIVTILESGIASERYYFAMQYVEGQRLDAWLADRSPTLRQKLDLFRRICDAVNYAHLHGVIHRDLKPSNILVDADGAPHVVDFGLAKLAESDTPGEETRALISVTGQIMGTLPYMSPEQTTGSHRDIDTRTDVYSLGVILYEMLTGTYPYPVIGRMADVLRNIAEAEPERPSTLIRTIDDEVQTIILKALAKEKDRRYQTADGLARDVERYLKGEPIEAKRDSATYVLRKMLRRYRVPVGVVATFVAVLVLSTVFVATHRIRLDRAEADLIMARLVDEPAAAVVEIGRANARVNRYLADLSLRFVDSSAYTERIMGARSGFIASPEAFWGSVDQGPLWENGEWLELARLPWDAAQADAPSMPASERASLIAQLKHYATRGSMRQQYVAFCLLGHFAPIDDETRDLCIAAVREGRDPGVIAAAAWAARRHGSEVAWPAGEDTFIDGQTGLVFVRIPGTDAYRRGADPSDEDQLPDERPVAEPVAIEPFLLAATEVTLEAIRPFVEDSTHHEVLGPRAVQALQARLADRDRGEATRIAAGYISLNAARAYCQWLTDRAAGASPARRYRLPTEDEWEYACRAGNRGRFNYGDSTAYLRYFAHADGEAAPEHRVAMHMPNAWGLFDMHGGLWERTDSRYPPEFVDEPAHRGRALWVHRGGAYYSPARRCRATQRNYAEADAVDQYVGLRLVMGVVEP